jgi:hypothetical protein
VLFGPVTDKEDGEVIVAVRASLTFCSRAKKVRGKHTMRREERLLFSTD